MLLIAYFFGGAFLANVGPQCAAGLPGRGFKTLFAKPPSERSSSPLVNFQYSMFNLVAASTLIARVGAFAIRVCRCGRGLIGKLLIGVPPTKTFGDIHGGATPPRR